MSGNSRNSGLDRSTSMAFAFFNRRHSSALGLRRSLSSVSSRRHSSPISQSDSLSDSETESKSSPTSRFPRSLRWRLLARKVLGNVDEETFEDNDTKANGDYFFPERVSFLILTSSFSAM